MSKSADYQPTHSTASDYLVCESNSDANNFLLCPQDKKTPKDVYRDMLLERIIEVEESPSLKIDELQYPNCV